MKPTITALLVLVLAGHVLAESAPRPNILYFYVDDMGWGSIGPNGQDQRREQGLPSVKTPNLDQLARAGVNFTRGYGCFVCSPARSSQQTGFHQGHTFADRNDPDNAKKAIRSDDVTMGDALLAAGYATGYWGKWGYGGSKDQQNPTIDNVQTLPTSHGYQHVLAELHHVRAHTFFQPTLWSAPAAAGAKGGLQLAPNQLTRYQNNDAYPSLPAHQNHDDYPKTAYCDDTYAFAALDFVRDQSKQYNETGKPFFGLFAAQIPHAPFDEIAKLPNWNAAYQDDPHFASLPQQAQQWAAMVTRIDAHFGNILTALEDPNNDGDKSDSVAANTLVIFQSDNGGPAGASRQALGANANLRGNKGQIYEGGIRVPLVMRWPGKIDPGSTLDTPVDVTDLLPTFCELAGVESPLGIDGVSISHDLIGHGTQHKREFLIHEAGNGQSIIYGDYKLVRAFEKQPKGNKKNRPAKIKTQLFDLAVDPSESNDIAASHPKLVQRFSTLLLAERVDEPKGFANTYHHWTGASGADITNADNWTVYEYANAGITYTTDDGAPQLSWVAKMHNASDQQNEAVANTDVSFLALEVSGSSPAGRQSLEVSASATLTARNEMRVGPHAKVKLDGGSINTQRWVTLSADSQLTGHGAIQGDVSTSGQIHVAGGNLSIRGDLNVDKDATTRFGQSIEVTGVARLGGQIQVDPALIGDSPVTLVTAKKIAGQFTVESDAAFVLKHTDDSVVLTPKP